MAKAPLKNIRKKYGRDLELLFEIGSLRNVNRGWIQHLGTDVASDLEHTMRVVFLALIIARHEKVINEEKIIKMALVHDLAETRVSDHSYIQKVYVEADEEKAVHDTFTGTSLVDFIDVNKDFESRKSIEAKIVKDADNLDVELELRELEERGHKLTTKWKHTRRIVRTEKLYTKTAKKMWDAMQKADPADWHLFSNKYFKIPNAGL